MEDQVKFTTTIKPSYLRNSLVKGTLFAGIGALVLIFHHFFLADTLVFVLKLIILLLALECMILGLSPYKRLYQLSIHPEEIIIDLKHLTYLERKKAPVQLPVGQIQRLVFFERRSHYGIGVVLSEKQKKLLLSQRKRKRLEQKLGVDIYLPYFSRKTYEHIKETLEK